MALWEREFDRISADWISGLTETPISPRNTGGMKGNLRDMFFSETKLQKCRMFFLAAK